ncbi:MAG: hypothetical protein PHW76_05770 [Alphaproteobacteria bacterium]|nr:hypothetical protein [Alphaproteobacteria bacterium]
MEDKGEKIVFLARELLEAGAEPPVTKKTTTITMTLKTLCITTFLAAATGNVLSMLVQEQIRPLNKYEKIELEALVFYAAKIKNISEDLLREEVEKQVHVDSFDDISSREFSAARLFLQKKAR